MEFKGEGGRVCVGSHALASTGSMSRLPLGTCRNHQFRIPVGLMVMGDVDWGFVPPFC